MVNQQMLTYELLQRYYRSQSDDGELREIQLIADSNAVAELLIRIVNYLKTDFPEVDLVATDQQDLSYGEIDSLLVDILGGAIARENGLRLASQLYNRPHIYDKIWLKCQQMIDLEKAALAENAAAAADRAVERTDTLRLSLAPDTVQGRVKWYDWIPVVAAMLIIASTIGGIGTVFLAGNSDNIFRPSPVPEYFAVYEFDSNQLKSAAGHPSQEIYNIFVESLIQAQSKFNQRAYRDVIADLEEPDFKTAVKFLREQSYDSTLQVSGEYYFVLGSAYLEVAKSLLPVADNDAILAANRATRNLSIADSLVNQTSTSSGPREAFYLAQAHHVSAVARFASLSKNSEYAKVSGQISDLLEPLFGLEITDSKNNQNLEGGSMEDLQLVIIILQLFIVLLLGIILALLGVMFLRDAKTRRRQRGPETGTTSVGPIRPGAYRFILESVDPEADAAQRPGMD